MAKFFTYSLLAAAMGLSLNAFAQNATSTPALTFAVDRGAVDATMEFKISAVGGAAIQVDWGNGELKDYTIVNYDDDGWVFSSVSGTISGTSIKVYVPDATKINYLDLDWDTNDAAEAKIRSVDLSKMTGVKELSLSKNILTSVDLSAMTSLKTFNAYDNNLSSLTLPQGDNALTSVNVSNNFNTATGVKNEDAGNNNVLATKWSNAPGLTSLNLNGNSYNELGWFDSFDISKNTKLKTLHLNGCDLPDLDVSPLTALKTLNAQWNVLTTMDLSKNDVTSLSAFLAHNNLESIKLPANASKMTRLNVAYNALTFTTLPTPGFTTNATNYVYSPQAEIANTLNGKNFADYSSLAMVGETESVFKFKAILGDATEQTELSIDNAQYNQTAPGVFRFDVPVKDLQGEITNSVFPALTLTTTKATSMGLFPKMASLELTAEPGALEAESPITLTIGSSAEEPQDVYIDWGDGTGELTTLGKDSWGDPISIQKPVLGSKIEIYGDPTTITSFSCRGSYDWTTGKPKGMLVSKADVSALKEITQLDFMYNLLTDIDLSANKKLTKVVLNSNKINAFEADLPELTTLDLGNYGSNADRKYGANAPSVIDFAKIPKLETLTVSYTGYNLDFTKVPNLKNVYAIANSIKSVDLSNSAALTYLTLNYNELETLDATPITGKANLFATNNKLTSVKVAKNLGNVNVSNNYLTFATLPATDAVSGTLYYSPQNPMEVTADKGVVDLSSQLKVGETATVYAWTLNGEDASGMCNEDNGSFTFSKAGEYVCEMKNAAFPDLTLSTTAITIDAAFVKPVKLFSFTVAPAAAGKTMALNISSTDNQSVQVDWGAGILSDPVATKDYVETWEYGTPTGVVAGENIIVYGTNAATINKLDLSWSKDAGEETKMLTVDLSALTGVNDITLASNALTSLDLTGNVALAKLFINGNNITDVKFPENCVLTRLEAQNTENAGENNMFKVDLSKAPMLNYLIMNFNNKNAEATTIDLSKNVELATVLATDCNLETIDVSKLAKLVQLTVNNNNLTSVDVSQMTSKGRLFAMNNKLSSLVLPEKLTTLNVSNNKLTFATLPATTIATAYTYNNQKPMVVEAKDGKVDLSSQAMVGEVETVFAWTADAEEFKDFTVTAGMFTFTKSAKNAVCTMTNAALPALTLTTIPVDVEADSSAVTEIEGAASEEEAVYYNLQGVKVSGNEPGIYIRRQGNKTTKVIVK